MKDGVIKENRSISILINNMRKLKMPSLRISSIYNPHSMRFSLSRLLTLMISLSVVSLSYAVTYPTSPNPGGTEVTGGYFNTYFTNMFTDCFV